MAPTSRISREPITVIAELRFDPRHRDAVLDLAQRHVRNTLAAERDCLRFELVAPKDEPGVLVFSELFASEAALGRPPAVAPCLVVQGRPRTLRRRGHGA